MSVASRVLHRFLDRRIAARVVGRLLWAMSRDQAKRVLRIPPHVEPSDEEIKEAYQARVKDTIRKTPDAAIGQEALKDLNIAKDTLRGQFDRKRPGEGPNAPEAAPRREQVPLPPPIPPPMPEGVPFTTALHSLGNIDWKIITDGAYKSDVLVDSEGPPRQVYWAIQQDFVLLGKTDSHYVFAKLTKLSNTRKDHRDKTVLSAWSATKIVRPLATTNLVKVAPKVINGMREGAWRRAKFMLLESNLTESKLEHLRGTLPLADAILGAGLLQEGAAAPAGRKVQVELEPVMNREKYKDLKARGSIEWHHAYDWFLYLNGKRTQLSEREVEALKTNHVLIGVFSYNYEGGKKNLTRLRGSGFKLGPKEALQQLAKSLDAGPERAAVEQVAAAFT